MIRPIPGLDVPIDNNSGTIQQTWYIWFQSLFASIAANTATVALIGSSSITSSLGADTAISNSVYSDGPSIIQGTSGKWWVSGTVTISDTGSASFSVKLWDGTTVIASGRSANLGANIPVTITLSGFITSPAANIKISATSNAGGATSTFKFNSSGNSKDCTISAFRIA